MAKKVSFDLFVPAACVECGSKVNVTPRIVIAVCPVCSHTRSQQVLSKIEMGIYQPRNYVAEYFADWRDRVDEG